MIAHEKNIYLCEFISWIEIFSLFAILVLSVPPIIIIGGTFVRVSGFFVYIDCPYRWTFAIVRRENARQMPGGEGGILRLGTD